MRRALPLALLLVAAAVGAGLFWGRGADACAEALESAVQRRDWPAVRGLVQSPRAEERLAAAAKVELLFVRPGPSGGLRVGYALSPTLTATRAEALVLHLEAEAGRCRFVADFDEGAFTR